MTFKHVNVLSSKLKGNWNQAETKHENGDHHMQSLPGQSPSLLENAKTHFGKYEIMQIVLFKIQASHDKSILCTILSKWHT